MYMLRFSLQRYPIKSSWILQYGSSFTVRLTPSALARPISRTVSTNSVTTSIWESIIPKYFRGSGRSSHLIKAKTETIEWNPATFYIVIFLIIGSNAIQMIALRNNNRSFDRKVEARLALLREVIERVQRGEDIDIEGILGTGTQNHEEEWDEVMQELWGIDEAKTNKQQAVGARANEEAAKQEQQEQERNKEFAKPPNDIAASDRTAPYRQETRDLSTRFL